MDAHSECRRLAATFDRAASLYHRARPDYPDELYADLLDVTGLTPGSRLLEVGCATGKATLPLARRGFAITCLEPGASLAREARKNMAEFDVEVVESRLEDWAPSGERFALVYAATAWHWVDPSVGYRKAAEALYPGGHLATWEATHVFPIAGDPFFEEIQAIYDEIGEGLPANATLPRPQALDPNTGDIEASGLFELVQVRQYDWEVVYDADGYVDLLNTFSGHLEMEDWQRSRLYGAIRERLSSRPDGLVRRHWGAVLRVARVVTS